MKTVENEKAKTEKELRKTVHMLRMKEEDNEGLEITNGDFGDVLKRFGGKKTKSYDFLLKSGRKYKESMFNLCKKMIDKEGFPLSFRKTMLYMICRGRDLWKSS